MTTHQSATTQAPRQPEPSAPPGVAAGKPGATKLPNGRELPPTGYEAQRTAVSPATQNDPATAQQTNPLGGTEDSITTLGGTFTRERFAKHMSEASGDKRRGAEMRLSFLASEGVDCQKIALVQTVACQRQLKDETDKTPFYGGSDKRSERATGGGTNVDREEGYDNPAFGAPNDDLEEAETAALREALDVGDDSVKAQKSVKKGHVGGRKGRFATKSWLEDKSKLKWNEGDTIETTFEVAAVGQEGALAGVYLGTVAWSYTVSANDVISLTGLTLVSAGTPTQEFSDAAAKWNAQSYTHDRYFSPDEAVQDGYLSTHKTHHAGDGHLSVDVDNQDVALTSRTAVPAAPDVAALKQLQDDLTALETRKTAGNALPTDDVDKANLTFQIARYAKLLPAQ